MTIGVNYRARIETLRVEERLILAERNRALDQIRSEIRQARAERNAEIKRLRREEFLLEEDRWEPW